MKPKGKSVKTLWERFIIKIEQVNLVWVIDIKSKSGINLK